MTPFFAIVISAPSGQGLGLYFLAITEALGFFLAIGKDSRV